MGWNRVFLQYQIRHDNSRYKQYPRVEETTAGNKADSNLKPTRQIAFLLFKKPPKQPLSEAFDFISPGICRRWRPAIFSRHCWPD